jgi:hypothetical protein
MSSNNIIQFRCIGCDKSTIVNSDYTQVQSDSNDTLLQWLAKYIRNTFRQRTMVVEYIATTDCPAKGKALYSPQSPISIEETPRLSAHIEVSNNLNDDVVQFMDNVKSAISLFVRDNPAPGGYRTS